MVHKALPVHHALNHALCKGDNMQTIHMRAGEVRDEFDEFLRQRGIFVKYEPHPFFKAEKEADARRASCTLNMKQEVEERRQENVKYRTKRL